MIMTKEYLYQEYIVKGRSQSEIAKDFGCTPKNINYYVRKYKLKGIKSRIKFSVNEAKISVENPIFCYLAGLVATDGHIDYPNNRITIRVNNEGSDKVLQNLLDYFECKLKVAKYKTGYEIRITSKHLINELAKLNVKGKRKTYDLSFPTCFHSTSCKQMYLRGILDGDGNIHVTVSKYTKRYIGGQFRLVTYSEDFIIGFIECVNNTLNLNCKLSYTSINNGSYPKIEMRTEESKTFYRYIYEGYPKFRFPDKYTKYLKLMGEEIV